MAESQKKRRIYRGNRPKIRTMSLSARIDPDSDAGRIVKHLLDEGYSKSEIVETAILTANGNIPKKDSIDEEVLLNLRNAIDRLEKLGEALSVGAPLTPQQQRIVGELKPEFVEAMKRSARPAFRPDQ